MNCVVCHLRPAKVPDRDRPGRPIKRVCRECHAQRLIGDLQTALALHQQRMTKPSHQSLGTTVASGTGEMRPKLMSHEERKRFLLIPIRCTRIAPKSWGGSQIQDIGDFSRRTRRTRTDESYIRYAAPDDANQGEL